LLCFRPKSSVALVPPQLRLLGTSFHFVSFRSVFFASFVCVDVAELQFSLRKIHPLR
jgi:hypothetical protein